jgi:UDP-3-O-[3-hydroxymyristoyl] glucosamine N-acyltransferase
VGASSLEDAARGRKELVFLSERAISVRQVEGLLGLDESGVERSFSRLSSYEDADADSIVFAQDHQSLEKALASAAGLILAPIGVAHEADRRLRPVKDPKHAFAMCGRWIEGLIVAMVHPSAMIDAAASVGSGTSVGAGAVIEAGAVVGERCSIGSNVTIYGSTVIGDNVLVKAGAVLGAMGFGYVRGEDGSYVRFPQQGRLVIEDEVEIGANTTIDRGALGETRIGRGTKIDNQVHIGHNCRIGKNVVIAAQVGISGSCVVEDGVVMAGQVGLGDHVYIGPGVILGGASGVFPGKRLEGPGQMYMGVPAEPLKDYLKTVARVRRLKNRD